MKLSNGLKMMLEPLMNFMPLPDSLFQALRKTGKRGKGTYYPTDLKRVNVILEVTSELSERTFEVLVTNGDIMAGLKELARMLREEEHFLEMKALTY